MSEIKRATLVSFASQKLNDKKTKTSGKTKRISLVLPESNEDTCPEYNYKEELAASKVSYNRKWLRFQGKGTSNSSSHCKYSNTAAVIFAMQSLSPPGVTKMQLVLLQAVEHTSLIFYYSKCLNVII